MGKKVGEKVREKTGENVGESFGEIDKLNLCLGSFNENRFQVTIFFKFKRLLVLFLVQNGPGVTWVACIGLKEGSIRFLGCARAFLEAFLDLL